jgi:RNA polymerase sigma-70 factor, ECF subfamily
MTPAHLTALRSDTDSFVRARPRLLRVARRVLANPADADDVVQDAWMRWQDADRSTVRDPVAFLVTTTTRLAINVGQSAHARRETAFTQQLAEVADPGSDPLVAVERRHAIESALGIVVKSLSPSECGVYLLREAFDYPHRRIALALGLTEANTRQLATRARNHVGGESRRRVGTDELRWLVDAFFDAVDTGDLDGLEKLLNTGIGEHVPLAA